MSNVIKIDEMERLDSNNILYQGLLFDDLNSKQRQSIKRQWIVKVVSNQNRRWVNGGKFRRTRIKV